MIFLCGGMFVFAAIFLAKAALDNNRGLIINGIIELSENGATNFYWILCFLSSCFVIAAIALIFHRLKFRQRIALTSTGIILPASRWSAQEKFIEYQNISNLLLTKVNHQKFLEVLHSEGKSIINASMMPSRKAFEEISNALSKKITGKPHQN